MRGKYLKLINKLMQPNCCLQHDEVIFLINTVPNRLEIEFNDIEQELEFKVKEMVAKQCEIAGSCSKCKYSNYGCQAERIFRERLQPAGGEE